MTEIKSDFSEWLNAQLNERGWKKIELVKRSGLSRNYTYDVINGKKFPGVAACLAISRALNVSVETVFSQTGDQLHSSGLKGKKSEFSEWIEDQLSDRGLNKSDLVKRSGLETAYVDNIVNGKVKPNVTDCRAISRALDVSDEIVLREVNYHAHKSLPYNGSDFTAWISEQLTKRGLNKHDFAERSGIDKSHIYQILLGKNRPGPEGCRAIARGLDVPEVIVFRQIGYLTEDPIIDPSVETFITIISQLAEDDQSELLEIARLKLNLQNRL